MHGNGIEQVEAGSDVACVGASEGAGDPRLTQHQGPWRDFDQVERALVQWVSWYNSERLHSALGYVPPDEYEQAYGAQPEETPQTA